MEVHVMSNAYHGEDGSSILPSLCKGDDPFLSLLISWDENGGRYQKAVRVHFNGMVNDGHEYQIRSKEEAV